MAVKPLRCPHCGGVIETFDETMKKGFCPFCDNLIEDVQERQAEMTKIVMSDKTEQPKKTGKARTILRLIITILFFVFTVIFFIIGVGDSSYLACEWKELIQWLPYSILLVANIGLLVWNIAELIANIRHQKQKKKMSIFLLILSGVILAGGILTGATLNHIYKVQCPEGQLARVGIAKDDIKTVLDDFEKFGFYNSDKEYFGKNSDHSLQFLIKLENDTYGSDTYKITATDFVLKDTGYGSDGYCFEVENGHVTEIYCVDDFINPI